MYIDDIYQSKILKYPLTDDEYSYIPDAWRFLRIFKKNFVFFSDYREYVMKKIRKNYTPEEFFMYETILNKMFWNLRWLTFPLWIREGISEEEYEDFVWNNYNNQKELPYSLLLCEFQTYKDYRDREYKIFHNKLFEDTYYRSFINKLMIIDKVKKMIITKPIEGSSEIFSKNYFNLLTISILFDRDLYKEIMHRPYKIKNKKFELSNYYYEYDYGFPNLNYCVYTFGTLADRMERIKKMYYSEKPKATWWFRLIR